MRAATRAAMVATGRRLPAIAAMLAATLLPAAPAAAAPDPPPSIQGWIVTKWDTARCLTGGPTGTALHTTKCERNNAGQNWYQQGLVAPTLGPITVDGLCLKPDSLAAGAAVRTADCDDSAPHWRDVSTFRIGSAGPCLTQGAIDAKGYGSVSLRPCAGARNQKWRDRTPEDEWP